MTKPEEIKIVKLSNENIKRLTWGGVSIFLIINIAFAPNYSLSIPIDTPFEAIGWLGIIILSIFTIYNFKKVELKNLFSTTKFKLDDYASKSVEGNHAANLALTGMCIWLFAIYLKDGPFVAPFVVAGSLTMLWSILIFFEESSLVKGLSSYSSSKKLFSFLAACIVFWATYTTFGQANELFGVDASYFPFAITVGIFINIAKVSSLISIILFPLSLVLTTINIATSSHKIWNYSRQAVLFCTLIISFLMLFMIGPLWSIDFIESKLLKSAETMDMNSNHLCHNEELILGGVKLPVIFLGPNSSTVLFKKEAEFDITECNPLNKPIK
ncbi:hypothetical protein DOK_17038 [gamma proteobacterium BDW918]|nr:hypothetical protein DOK_17038 [gamma proteobacterium BDW918]